MASARVFANRCRSLLAATKTSTAVSASVGDAVAKTKGGAIAGAGAAKAKGRVVATKPKGDAVAKPKGRPQGILKPQPISAAFQQFLGVSEVSRSDAVKQVWVYIKNENLQNPENKREINCDKKLKSIFGDKEKVGFLEIASLISKHFQKSA